MLIFLLFSMGFGGTAVGGMIPLALGSRIVNITTVMFVYITTVICTRENITTVIFF
jgi:hypothetical protein